jgi:hypothetical protein
MLKKHSKLIIYLIGLVLITTILYFAVLKHPGYIFYWDLSGAFDFRDPFGQYFRLYTPWDGITLGIKNRIPLVTLIYLIYLPFKLLGSSNYTVIKLSVVLLFLGAYTTMYFLFPKFLKILTKGRYGEKNINIWAMIMALLYSFIPFYAYRLSQLHLFYMSIFYPIHIHLFLKLLKSQKFDIKTIMIFVISMFFGLTSPNIIIFELLSFLILFIIDLFAKKFAWRRIKKPLLNIFVGAIGVLVSSLYWLIPYFKMGSPQPGYVISEYMIDMLSQGSSLVNFLLGQADWFVGQGDLGVLDAQSASINIVQVIGCVLLYLIAIITLFKYLNRKHAIFISILLFISFYLVLDFVPFHKEIFSFLIYSPIGWVFREINRISFFWYFWIYIIFSLGIFRIYQSIRSNKENSKVLRIIFIPAIIIPFVIYLLPINIKIFKYLKPVKIDSSITEVFQLLEDDKDYFSVFYYPRVDYYRIPWLENKFDIADSEEYKWLVYNSPKPPVYNSSVIPKEKTPQALYTQYIFEESQHLDRLGFFLKNVGVKYVVVRKAADPINITKDYARAEVIYPMYYNLERDSFFDLVLENEYYAVFKNLVFDSVVKSKENTLYSLSSFTISEHLPKSVIEKYNIRFCTINQNWDSCFDNNVGKKYIVYDDDIYSYLNLLDYEEKTKYGYYPFDYTYQSGINVDWGRGSYYDAINGELHNVFRKYDIHAWDFDIVDKVVYSDHSFVNYVEEKENTTSELTFTSESVCNGECTVFANVLFNHIGGDLKISINNQEFSLDTKSDFEKFKWVKLGEINLSTDSNIKFSLTSRNSFNAIGGILILSQDQISELTDRYDALTVTEVPHDSILSDFTYIDPFEKDVCNFDTVGYRPLNLNIIPNDFCKDKESIYITNHNYDFLLQRKNESEIDIKDLEPGMEYEVVLTSLYDFWVLFGGIATLIILIIILGIILF